MNLQTLFIGSGNDLSCILFVTFCGRESWQTLEVNYYRSNVGYKNYYFNAKIVFRSYFKMAIAYKRYDADQNN